MINKLKTFAITMMVTGATVAATTASAVVDTNTFTNVIQNIQISLTAYSNAPIKSATLMTGEKPVTITTKTVLGALSNASGLIPSLVGFNWGKSPQLVLRTIFASTNTVSNTVTAVATNTVTILGTSNIVSFSTNTNTYPTNGTEITITDTIGTATLTNEAGTNILTQTGTWVISGSNVIGTAITFIATNSATNANAGIPTNAGLWTVFTAATNAANAAATNVTAITYTNVPHTSTNYMTNSQGVEVQGGTAEAPTFASVVGYVSGGPSGGAILTATGTGFGTTNAIFNTGTENDIGSAGLHVFDTTAGTATGNNLDVSMSGFFKVMFKNDVLHQVKGLTNQVGDVETYTGTVSGSGYIGGSFVTNNSPGTNVWSNYINLPVTEYNGTNTAFTNQVSGTLTNPVQVVVEGTITVGAPKNVAQ